MASARVDRCPERAPKWYRRRASALQTGDDPAQAGGLRQLAITQRRDLALRGQPPHSGIGPVPCRQAIRCGPRNMLQKCVKNRILVPHGSDLLSCPDSRQPSRTEGHQCPAPGTAKNIPDSSGSRPVTRYSRLQQGGGTQRIYRSGQPWATPGDLLRSPGASPEMTTQR